MRTGGEEESGDSQKIVLGDFGGILRPQPIQTESGDSQKIVIETFGGTLRPQPESRDSQKQVIEDYWWNTATTNH